MKKTQTLENDDLEARLLEDLQHAEREAWNALARYKFQMFGYWAAIWVHLNRIGKFRRPNPFRELVKAAKESNKGKNDSLEGKNDK